MLSCGFFVVVFDWINVASTKQKLQMCFYAKRRDGFLPVRVSTSAWSPISVCHNERWKHYRAVNFPALREQQVLSFFFFFIRFKVNNLQRTNQHVTGTGPGFENWMQTPAELPNSVVRWKLKWENKQEWKRLFFQNWHPCFAGACLGLIQWSKAVMMWSWSRSLRSRLPSSGYRWHFILRPKR